MTNPVVNLSPFLNLGQQLSFAGSPLNSGKIYTYLAGTTTPATTYTTISATTSNANPIILNQYGILTNAIWLVNSTSYKFVITDSNNNILQTLDDITGLNQFSVYTSGTDILISNNVISYYIPQTQAEINAAVLPVNYNYPQLYVQRYGNPVDGIYAQDALLAAINVAAQIRGAAFIDAGVSIQINQSLDTLTTNIIRIVGAFDCCKSNAANTLNENMPTIICNGCSVVGNLDWSTQTITWTDQLKLLQNVQLLAASGGAETAIVSLPYGSEIAVGCHIQGFTHFGIVVNSANAQIGPYSSIDVGLGLNGTNALDSGSFIDGCAGLSIGNVTSGVAGNFATALQNNPSTYGGQCRWTLYHYLTVNPETSFKAFIAYNQQSLILDVQGFGGIFLGYCFSTFVEAPHLEIYSTGGAVANDGQPFALVTLNCSPHITAPFYQTSIVWEPVPVRQYYTVRNAENDFFGYDYGIDTKRAIMRAHIGELQLGYYYPDADSSTLTPLVSAATATNPIAVFDATTNSLLISKGNSFLPLVSLPTFQTGTLANSTNVTTVAPTYTNWDVGGGTAYTDGGVEYEISVLAISAAGEIFHQSTWRYIAATVNAVITPAGTAVNPVAGIAVTTSGALLNIANTSGFTVNWRAMYRLLGPAVGAPVN